MASKLGYYVRSEQGVRTVWVRNGSGRYPLFRSNDSELIRKRLHDIGEDINKMGHANALVALYRFAKHHGCIEVIVPVTGGILSMKPVGKEWELILRRGINYIIVRRDEKEKIREAYMNLLKIKQVDPKVLDTMWDYAMQKAKVEVKTN